MGSHLLLSDETLTSSFTEWVQEAEPRLRHALTVSFGPQVGKDATMDALSLAWERWDDIRMKDNPLGYVFGVGRNKARRIAARRSPVFLDPPPDGLPHVEPQLPAAFAALSERQRVVVGLVYGFEWSLGEVAELLEVAKTTVQKHAERGILKLRKRLGVEL